MLPWIKMTTCLRDKPEVLRISELTGLDVFGVVGRLHAIWSWADTHCGDCNAASVTQEWIDVTLSCDSFAKAMIEVGWLSGENWNLEFPGYARHNGPTAKRRALTAQRMRNLRSKNVTHDASPEEKRSTPPTPSRGNTHKPPPVAPAGERLPPKSRSDADPRYSAVIRSWCVGFEAAFGRKYPFDGGKDGAQLKRFLKLCSDPTEEITQMAIAAWGRSKQPYAKFSRDAGTLCGFLKNYAAIIVELAQESHGTKPDLKTLHSEKSEYGF
jgi:hypothetical protein